VRLLQRNVTSVISRPSAQVLGAADLDLPTVREEHERELKFPDILGFQNLRF